MVFQQQLTNKQMTKSLNLLLILDPGILIDFSRKRHQIRDSTIKEYGGQLQEPDKNAAWCREARAEYFSWENTSGITLTQVLIDVPETFNSR